MLAYTRARARSSSSFRYWLQSDAKSRNGSPQPAEERHRSPVRGCVRRHLTSVQRSPAVRESSRLQRRRKRSSGCEKFSTSSTKMALGPSTPQSSRACSSSSVRDLQTTRCLQCSACRQGQKRNDRLRRILHDLWQDGGAGQGRFTIRAVRLFRVLDNDKSGFIDRNELMKIMCGLGTETFRAPEPSDVDALISQGASPLSKCLIPCATPCVVSRGVNLSSLSSLLSRLGR